MINPVSSTAVGLVIKLVKLVALVLKNTDHQKREDHFLIILHSLSLSIRCPFVCKREKLIFQGCAAFFGFQFFCSLPQKALILSI